MATGQADAKPSGEFAVRVVGNTLRLGRFSHSGGKGAPPAAARCAAPRTRRVPGTARIERHMSSGRVIQSRYHVTFRRLRGASVGPCTPSPRRPCFGRKARRHTSCGALGQLNIAPAVDSAATLVRAQTCPRTSSRSAACPRTLRRCCLTTM